MTISINILSFPNVPSDCIGFGKSDVIKFSVITSLVFIILHLTMLFIYGQTQI